MTSQEVKHGNNCTEDRLNRFQFGISGEFCVNQILKSPQIQAWVINQQTSSYLYPPWCTNIRYSIYSSHQYSTYWKIFSSDILLFIDVILSPRSQYVNMRCDRSNRLLWLCLQLQRNICISNNIFISNNTYLYLIRICLQISKSL